MKKQKKIILDSCDDVVDQPSTDANNTDSFVDSLIHSVNDSNLPASQSPPPPPEIPGPSTSTTLSRLVESESDSESSSSESEPELTNTNKSKNIVRGRPVVRKIIHPSLSRSRSVCKKKRRRIDLNVCTTTRVKATKVTRGVQFEWRTKGRKQKRRLHFSEVPKINIMPKDPTSPLSLLKLFLSNPLVQKFVDYTNTYANQIIRSPNIQKRMAEKERSMYKTWVDTNLDEMWVYISITSLIGIIKKPQYSLYWTNDPMFSTPIFSQLMSRTRFDQIRSMVHYSDPINFDPYDSMKKLRVMIDDLGAKFADVYTPEKNLCIDEYLSLWKGRLPFKIYIPSKRERYGIKIYMNCESATRYLLGFIIYTGADTNYGDAGTMRFTQPFDEHKSPSKVLLSLLRKYTNKSYTVTLDNLYSSPELASCLLNQKIDSYGTLRKKQGLPKDFWSWKPIKGDKPMKQYCGDMIALRWNDNKNKINKDCEPVVYNPYWRIDRFWLK